MSSRTTKMASRGCEGGERGKRGTREKERKGKRRLGVGRNSYSI